VRRHVDLVHSAALRMVRDAHLAQDVTQGVFVALAKNAAPLADRPVLAGWLHRTAQNLAAQTVRTDVRRRAREQEAAAMNELLADQPEAIWEHVAPLLDEALGELAEPDRDAVLLRYFERKSAREMAQTLGVSDEAAQKRVSRAVERLREFFARRGVSVGASGLAVSLTANAVQAAPAGLAVAVSTAAALAGTTFATAVTTATKTIAMTTLQKTVFGAVLAGALGTAIYEARQVSVTQAQMKTLQQEQGTLFAQVEQLQRERDRAASQLAAQRDENDLLNSNALELARLRGEVTRLRADSQELARLKNSGANDPSEATARAWTAKVNLLKEYVRQNPSAAVPEVQFIKEREWLTSIDPTSSYWPLETEDHYHQAMDILRDQAQLHFYHLITAALLKFTPEHKQPLPPDLATLRQHLEPAVADVLIGQWEMVSVTKLPPHAIANDQTIAGDWMIARKSSAREKGQRLAIVPLKGSHITTYQIAYY
jgi:RNA polymerase sigma factor (sigma-70 family)